MIRGTTVACLALVAFAAAAQDPRYCGTPARAPDGTIARSAAARTQFVKLYPCPSTGKTAGACPGWAVDHVIPLACGGCDQVGNMQWLPARIKSASGAHAKDRFERVIYCKRAAR